MDNPLPANIRKILRKLKNELVQIYGERLDNIILYGSRARGDERDDSDIDILIVIKNDFEYSEMLRLSSDLTASLSLEHDVVISRAFVSKNAFKIRQTPFIMNVRREGIQV